jgi:uncharacterized protein YgiM (DUF1202 family)
MKQLLAWISILTLAALACGVQAQTAKNAGFETGRSTAPTSELVRMLVTAENLNIRLGAGETFPAAKHGLHHGDVVTCFEFDGVWCLHELGWSNSLFMTAAK